MIHSAMINYSQGTIWEESCEKQLGEKKIQSLGPRRHTVSGRKRKLSKVVKEAVETVE